MNYKVVFMKDLSDQLNLDPAKSFNRSEKYLEYAIEEINKRSTKYNFHQYLYLIDKLYVVLVKKDSVVGYEKGQRPEYMKEGYITGEVKFPSENAMPAPTTPLEKQQEGLSGMMDIKDPDYAKKNLYKTELPWQK